MERSRVPFRAFIYIFIFVTVVAGTLYYYRASIFPSWMASGTLSDEEKYAVLDSLAGESAISDADKLKLLKSLE